ncbi:hypothetical protein CANARDRAFT_28785 [[Candida] arabinofermentans NRRL YB-2248]|uniref:Casein kinase II subunit beta n=1 Tax=[Candida] arabinofermentans NRRL YB-2248 TaxID=983967 RepID=A0A1E4T018_9ASCO|nr:hypothetical protein CANARDRAFT_28785 [[Candida] arabinofermentans NRRL YB-2248]
MTSLMNANKDLDSDSSEEMDTWISQYCSMFGHDYFVEVAPEFIEDDFNLTGLNSAVPFYRDALDVILDLEPETPIKVSNVPLVEHAAELLYGLIHARYILTKQGLHAMAEKYEENCFGVCPRYYCDGMHLIPVGRYDHAGVETVRLYCPNCSDIYLPSSSRYLNIDGSFFGTSFAGLFIKMFPEIERQCQERTKKVFELKLFGFKINEKAAGGPRMKWARQVPSTAEEIEEFNACEYGVPLLGGTQSDDQDEILGDDLDDEEDDEEEDKDHNDDDDDDDDDDDEEEKTVATNTNNNDDDDDEELDVRMSHDGSESLMSIAKS